MPLEMFRYIEGQDQCVGYDIIKPGDYRTIVDRPADLLTGENLDERLLLLRCKKDNSRSFYYTVHPLVLVSLFGHDEAMYTKDGIENRAAIILPGAEHIVKTRERFQGDVYANYRYRLAHR